MASKTGTMIENWTWCRESCMPVLGMHAAMLRDQVMTMVFRDVEVTYRTGRGRGGPCKSRLYSMVSRERAQ